VVVNDLMMRVLVSASEAVICASYFVKGNRFPKEVPVAAAARSLVSMIFKVFSSVTRTLSASMVEGNVQDKSTEFSDILSTLTSAEMERLRYEIYEAFLNRCYRGLGKCNAFWSIPYLGI